MLPVGDADVQARANHICRVYSDPEHYRAHAVDFLRQGLERGHRLEYIGGGSVEALKRELEHVTDLQDARARGDLLIRSVDDRYSAAPVDPAGQVADYAAATRAALADGYSGLRVAAEATPLVRTPQQRETFARYEHLVDRYMRDAPFFALCGYDERVLGPSAAAEIACLHPRTSEGSTPFRWWAAGNADIGLSGEVDIACNEIFDVTLARTIPLQNGSRVTVDACGLEFIDHRGMMALERRAQASGRDILLRTDVPIVRRLADLLELRAVEVG